MGAVSSEARAKTCVCLKALNAPRRLMLPVLLLPSRSFAVSAPHPASSLALPSSRVMVAWQPVGAAMGVVDVCARYIKQREQFGAPLASFQLIQERMVRMLATVQAMFLMAHRLTKLYEEGRMTHEQASLVKVRAGEKVGAGGIAEKSGRSQPRPWRTPLDHGPAKHLIPSPPGASQRDGSR